ncbi:MAG: hypothetical protein AB7P37_07630 [Ramlibacter sp.]
MKKFPLISSVLLASLLAACGGGGDDPDPTNLNSAFTITSATDATLNGAYGSSNTPLSGVNKLERIGATDSCSFTFENIPRLAGGAVAKGSVEYLVDSTTVRRLALELGGSIYETTTVGTSTVSRANNNVSFVGSVLSAGTPTVTISGTIPMRSDRPSGC